MNKLPTKPVPKSRTDDYADWYRIITGKPPREHKWDGAGERCVICGDKDWMQSECRGPSVQADGSKS